MPTSATLTSAPSGQLELITFAVEHVEAMVTFYNEVFGAGLTPSAGSPLYLGTLGSLPIQFCPNSIAGVRAEQNRHQLRLRVPDVAAACGVAGRFGGGVKGEPQDLGGRHLAALVDPDGNTIEIMG